MRIRRAALGSVLFFALAPGTAWMPVRLLGGGLLVAALPVLVSAFVRFVRDGLGTPAPVAPTERLVVTGAYRYVRNPMYLAVLSAIVGQGLLLGQTVLLGYAALVALLVVSFVRLYEEPALRRQVGEEYESYRRAVPGWLPRLHPWKG
jgi:protein-S-isoprenylcysteine O-methyltransferase Ste14